VGVVKATRGIVVVILGGAAKCAGARSRSTETRGIKALHVRGVRRGRGLRGRPKRREERADGVAEAIDEPELLLDLGVRAIVQALQVGGGVNVGLLAVGEDLLVREERVLGLGEGVL
jgi:hypothetical protein